MDVKTLESDLKGIVGERFTTSPFECGFYGSDIVAIPSWVRRFFTTTPVAVVKPESQEEVAAVLGYCADRQIPVVPRGAGTSGLFGAVPKKGGVVIDLRALQDVEIDEENLTVRTGAGITWWELDRVLQKKGFTLMSYPSSALSATVGGWIMGSGLGIGTLKYGPVFNQLLCGTMALPDGSHREYTKGQGLEEFFESEGVLGIMTQTVLKVRRVPERTSHYLLYFRSVKDLFDFVADLASTSPTPYDIEVADHSYLVLVKESGYEVTPSTQGGGTVLVTYAGSIDEDQAGKEVVATLSSVYRGELRDGAEEEWGHRFNMLRIKRAVPTVMPIGVHVPLTRLGEFYTSLAKIDKRRIGLLGHVLSKKEAMMMAMVVTDNRQPLEYALSLHVPSRIFDSAFSLGGGPGGGIGVWNSPYAGRILSKERSHTLREMKKNLDPKGVMNPGVWPDSSFLFAPGMYALGVKAASQLDKLIPSEEHCCQAQRAAAFLGEVPQAEPSEESGGGLLRGLCHLLLPHGPGRRPLLQPDTDEGRRGLHPSGR
jgi:FAD/FMN-containing dehydrogenase